MESFREFRMSGNYSRQSAKQIGNVRGQGCIGMLERSRVQGRKRRIRELLFGRKSWN
jgi:hypothetical protein